MKKIKLFALLSLATICFSSCNEGPRSKDPFSTGFYKIWDFCAPYLGCLLGIIVVILVAKWFIELLFPDAFSFSWKKQKGIKTKKEKDIS